MAEPQREWLEKDYYATLNVTEKATAADITKAYRKLARKLHPDANPGDPAAEDRFKEVSAAYDVIGDADKRNSYDEVRRSGPVGAIFGGAGGGGGAGSGVFNASFGDLLGGLFGRGPSGRSGTPSAQAGNDLRAELELSFTDAVHGIETSIMLTGDATCSTCSGTGCKQGSQPVTCEPCKGRGLLDDNQGLFSMSRPCNACAGRGSVITNPCATCRGQGIEVRNRKVRVRIPAGVKTGQTLRLPRRGAPGRGNGEPGDLLVLIKVNDHHLFGRSGKDLTLVVPITFAEAALGAEIGVPTLEGGQVTIRVPAGTSSGTTLRVRGKGVQGDLMVTFDVEVPSQLTEDQRSAIEALAVATIESPRTRLSQYQPRS